MPACCHSISRRFAPLVGSILLIAAASPALAEEELFLSKLPIVQSVSRLPQTLADAPGSVTILDRDMIRASGARQLNDLFRLVPGFQTYVFNTDSPPRVTYHGISDEDFSPRVQVLIDGRSLYSPLFRGGVNWSLVPVALEDIERIEVIRGSNSAAYGSNAFLGVINIITQDPSLAQGVSVSAEHGNQGVRDYSLRSGGKLGEAGHFRFTYQQQEDNGLRDQYDWRDDFKSRLFDARATLQLSQTDTLEIFAGHVEGNYISGRYQKGARLPGSNQRQILPQSDPCWPLHNIWQASSFIQTTWQRHLDNDAQLQLRYAHSEDKGSGRRVERCGDTRYQGDDDLLYEANDIGDKSTQDELELQHTFSPLAATRLVWGVGATHQQLRSPLLFHGNPQLERSLFRVFGNLEWHPTAQVTLNLGATAEKDSLSRNTFAPRLNLNYHFDPQNTLRLGWSRAYRTPNIIDLRGDEWKTPFASASGTPIPANQVYLRSFYADRQVRPEEINSLELAYLGEWTRYRMSLDVRLYRETIPNRILTLQRSNPGLCEVPEYPGACLAPTHADYASNAQHIWMEGLEYQWRWQPLDSTRLILNQAFHHIQARYRGDLHTSTQQQALNNIHQHTLQSAPTRSTTLMWMQKLPHGLEFSAIQHWVGAMKWTRNSEVRPYQRLDLRLAYRFRLGPTRGELAYTAQNAFSDHGEFKASGHDPADRVVSERHWLSLQLNY